MKTRRTAPGHGGRIGGGHPGRGIGPRRPGPGGGGRVPPKPPKAKLPPARIGRPTPPAKLGRGGPAASGRRVGRPVGPGGKVTSPRSAPVRRAIGSATAKVKSRTKPIRSDRRELKPGETRVLRKGNPNAWKEDTRANSVKLPPKFVTDYPRGSRPPRRTAPSSGGRRVGRRR